MRYSWRVYTGAVPVIYSLLFFSKYVASQGGMDKDKVSDDEISRMLTTRTSPYGVNGRSRTGIFFSPDHPKTLLLPSLKGSMEY